jgi:hypothetical protein
MNRERTSADRFASGGRANNPHWTPGLMPDANRMPEAVEKVEAALKDIGSETGFYKTIDLSTFNHATERAEAAEAALAELWESLDDLSAFIHPGSEVTVRSAGSTGSITFTMDSFAELVETLDRSAGDSPPRS